MYYSLHSISTLVQPITCCKIDLESMIEYNFKYVETTL